ncbi:nicotinate (nicotinamide) nucleotide adenylyltransferase [Paenibacillus doosanensis]|uniref:Probable nicotinate-nucleotide adenylyltransferase n=1 Tax=Paenibacillus konkukensis TaxID=2020716 RepID=A0ABY4RI68_9BACL|nr:MULTISPECIES: nicotinate (nicotinamide) nucleotide adenylyltransferase [Paenibacillus]MCS7460482.1 nicotinate (nicotinamide) nucleotide adenylyltransferase [Paenibacillus doosanensis]UQZ81299.1 Nicotinate-nucleotide adenylyltransferase [Paenibacillus konkukensis]
MKIGIYGSSFDPVTNVHLWTASTIAHRKRLDKVIFLPSSSRRLDKSPHAADEHRVAMIKLAIADNPKFELDCYELNVLAGMQYTYYTMEYFKQRYPADDLYFIMGADLLVDIGAGKWSHGEELVSKNKFIVMARNGIDMLAAIAKSPLLRNHDDGDRFQLVDKGLAMEISSTYIREEFARGGEPRYLLPDSCYRYIAEHGLYRS